MRGIIVAVALLGAASAFAAWSPTTIAEPMASTGSAFTVATNVSCASPPCDGPTFSIMASSTGDVIVDCTGTCRMLFQCRAPGAKHDVLIADSGSLTNAAAVVPFTSACPWVVPQISVCTGGTCSVSAWALELRGQ